MAAELGKLLNAVNNGEIVVFPVAARAGDIERCAEGLDCRHGAEAVIFWKSECRRLAAELAAIGVADDEISRQVLAFQAEVQAELVRRHQVRAVARAGSERRK